MKVIMISKDPKVFEKGSAVRNRMIEYGNYFSEIHVVIFAKTKHDSFEEKLAPNVQVYSPRSNNFLFIFIKTLGLSFRIAKKMIGGQDAWVTAQDPFETGIVAFIVSKLYHLRLQLQIHTDFLGPGFKREKFINRFRAWIAKKLLPHADSIRVVSNRINDSLKTKNLKLKTSSVHVLPIFVDAEKIKKQQTTFDLHKKYPEFEKIILVVARLVKEKNIDLALRAMQKVLHKLPKAGLVIAGSGPEEKWLKKYASYLKIDKNVRFEGWVDDLVSYYKGSDLFLVTSLYEGYGMTIIEAAASGCRVLSTDVGVAIEGGAEIVNYDPGEIALKIIEILNSPRKENLLNLPTKEEYLKKFKNTFT